jgi:methylated-DNA-[protein]-cysteine S-methyltransferase
MIDICIRNLEEVWFGVACDEKEIFATTFTSSEKRALKDLLGNIPFGVHFQRPEKISAFAQRAIVALKDIYNGKDVSENFSLATKHLSNYMRKVIKVTRLIPLGYVTSYGEIAKVAGGSPRAVGRIMASHPFAPIVPCHRVVASDFTLGGYGGGLDMKLAFLSREKRGYASKQEILVNSKKLELFPVEFVLRKTGKE